MARSRLWTAVIVCTLLLGFPRTGSAGLWDFIVEMSGPRMYGVSGDCRLILPDAVWDSCAASFPATLKDFVLKERPLKKPWIAFGVGYYYSVAKTINGHDFDYFDVNMLTFDPMFEFESKSSSVEYSKLRMQLYHGIGGSFNMLIVKGPTPMSMNGAIKIRPAGVVVPYGDRWGFDVSYDLRLYPRGFTADDFGVGPSGPDDGGWETVH